MVRSWTDNQIAEHAGKPDKCITKVTERVLTYWDREGGKYTNGLTTDVLSALMVEGRNPAGKTVADLGLPNPGLDDVIWAADEQDKAVPYCMGVTPPPPTPTPTPTPTPVPVPGKFNITFGSIPSGAFIWIDGRNTYQMTPETLALEYGAHDIELRLEGYDDYNETITVTADKSYTWTLTPEVKPLEPPIEIEVTRGILCGSVSIGQSTIPRRIRIDAVYTFRMHVDNCALGFVAKYKVTLTFKGHKNYTFPSAWSDPVYPDKYVNIYIPVALPSDSIPAGDDVAYYDLMSVLEGEKVT